MDIRSLRYFVETVRLSSFTLAAEHLNVTQSTISKMVRQLEDELGEPLLHRDSRPLQPTDTGRIVYERAREILGVMRQLSQEVRDTQALQRGVLEIGIPPMINLLFTQVLKQFRSKYPDIDIILREKSGQEIENDVANGELELGLTVLPVNPALDLITTPVSSHGVWAVGLPAFLRLNKNGTISLDALRKTPLVLLNDEFALTRLLKRVFAGASFDAHIAAQSSQWDWTVSMASAGMGIALLPEPLISRIRNNELLTVRVCNPEIPWQVAHIQTARRLSHAARAWLEMSDAVLNADKRSQAPAQKPTA